MGIDELWNNILNATGETFYTKTKLAFTFEKVDNNKVRINRQGSYVGYVSKEDINFILNNPNAQRHVYRDNMRTASYALAIYEALYK